MSNLRFKRVVYFLQVRFFNAPPSSKTLEKPPIKVDRLKIEKPSIKIKGKIYGDRSNTSISPSSFHVKYLTKSCGLSLESAILAAKKVILEKKNKEHYDSVINLLKSYEFSDTQIAKLVQRNPAVLSCRISDNLEPKIRFLAENGLVGSHLPKILILSPNILFRSIVGQLQPSMEVIRRFIKSPDMIVIAMQRGSWLLTVDWRGVQRNLDYLIEQGMPKGRIEELLVLQPRCVYQDISRIKYAVEMVKDMGVKPSELKFLHAFRVLLSLSELSWNRKVKIFESMGWSSEEVISTFVRSPHCMSCSEEKLRRTMDCFLNTVKIDRKVIIGYAKVLMYSIEKRIIPRYTVWKILEERKLIQNKQFIWVLNLSEKHFIEQYVTKFSVTIPHLLQIYENRKEDSIAPAET